jgi:integrase/recombinase XerD
VQSVLAKDGSKAYTVLDADYRPVQPVHDWLKHLKKADKATSTLRLYATALHHFWDWCAVSDKEWQTLTLEQLAEFTDYLAFQDPEAPGTTRIGPVERSHERGTVLDYLGAVYRFYTHLALGGMEPPFPLWEVGGNYKNEVVGLAADQRKTRPVAPSDERPMPKTLTIEQIRAVVDAQARWRNKFLFILLATTGMRIGAALGLRHADFRPWDQEVDVVRRLNANGATVKRSSARVQRPPMPKPLTSAAIRAHSNYMHEEYGDLDSDYIFVNLWGGKVGHAMTYQNVVDVVKTTQKKVGFHFSPHMFRHTFATLHLEAGMPADRVALLLDHGSMREAGVFDGPLSELGV